MSDEKSQAQQDKESRVQKIEEGLEKEYKKLFDDHQKVAEKAREDQPDNSETKEEYEARIKAVVGHGENPAAFDPNAAVEAATSTNVTPEEQAQTRPVETNVNVEETQKSEEKDNSNKS